MYIFKNQLKNLQCSSLLNKIKLKKHVQYIAEQGGRKDLMFFKRAAPYITDVQYWTLFFFFEIKFLLKNYSAMICHLVSI
jgi:hypothetical protein